jgi:hypothetical protein
MYWLIHRRSAYRSPTSSLFPEGVRSAHVELLSRILAVEKYVWKQNICILKSSAVADDRSELEAEERGRKSRNSGRFSGTRYAYSLRVHSLKPHILLQTHYHTLI